MKTKKLSAETQELVAILDKINELFPFSDYEGKTLYADGGKEKVSIEVQFNGLITIQLILRVIVDETVVYSWGCTDTEQNEIVARWFEKTKSEMFSKRFTLQEDKREHYKKIFQSL